ncbi:MAG TPA: hypothetical protein VMB26_06040 [Candidatus Binataceae bacterium]|nr:hypothetical protein [Candidatus Binataceae bacterium]
MTNRLGHHAIVIGGSIAGLMTARVLADYFDRVTILERDQIDLTPAVHKSVPQGHHLHALLLGGQQVMSALYPGFTDNLIGLGAVRMRIATDVAWMLPDGKAYTRTGSVREPRDLGIDIYAQSRGLLEHCIRQCTLAFDNIKLETGASVQDLIYDGSQVRGVRYDQQGNSHSLDGDLIIDAGGRGSHAPRWLKQLGFEAPAETTIGVDFAYSSAKFRLPDFNEPERLLIFVGPPPRFANGAILEQIEHNTWHVSLGGRFGDYPPTDDEGFRAFTRSLPNPKLYDYLKDAERISDIMHFRFPTSVQRHYERLDSFPNRFVVLGDAISSFNPIYGQGMSSAAMQVKALQQLLLERAADSRGLEGLASAFFPKAAEVIATPWILAATTDFAFPRTRGERPPNLADSIRYGVALEALAAEDPGVQLLMTEVFQLAKPIFVLMEEPLRSRAMAHLEKMS